MKDSNNTDLTVGCYTGLEACTSNLLDETSWDFPIYNYDEKSGVFSTNGDSGSIIFDGQGRMVGLLHSEVYNGGHTHVSYAALYCIQQANALVCVQCSWGSEGPGKRLREDVGGETGTDLKNSRCRR